MITPLPSFDLTGNPLLYRTLAGGALCTACARRGQQLGCINDDDNPDWFIVQSEPHHGGVSCSVCRRPLQPA